MQGAKVVWPFAQMLRHAVILGASGTGKTETSMRIAAELARTKGVQIFYLDAKGDRGSAQRFTSLMAASGVETKVFPNQPFNSWKGDWRAIANRLLEVVEFVADGPAAYYRDVAKTVLQLACFHPDGPPRSSRQLLARLDYEFLLDAHGPSSGILSVPRDGVAQVRMRYEAFFGQLGGALDGDWGWNECDSAYLLLDSVSLGEDANAAASMLFADFAYYFAQEKKPDRMCVLFVDEFAAIAGSSDLAIKVEQARGFNTAMVLVPQTPAGMGGVEQRARILGSVETVICHAVNEPNEIAELAGFRRTVQFNERYGDDVRLREGTARLEYSANLHSDEIRRLATGQAWVICRGRAAKVAIERAPLCPGVPLPAAQPLDETRKRVPVATPKELSYV